MPLRQLSLQHGDELPGIRTLAKKLVVTHNTVAKAYSELEHEGLLERLSNRGERRADGIYRKTVP